MQMDDWRSKQKHDQRVNEQQESFILERIC